MTPKQKHKSKKKKLWKSLTKAQWAKLKKEAPPYQKDDGFNGSKLILE